jgi:hypothetical protein
MKKQQRKLAPAEPYEKLEGMQRVIIDLTLGHREPANEAERKLLKEIDEIKKRGYIIDLPLD